MAGYNINDIVRDVRICLDENDVQNAFMQLEENTLMLDDIIKSKVGEAIDGVVISAPVELLGDGDVMPIDNVEWENGAGDEDELKMCRVKKPADYLRLVGAKMPDWDHAVSEVIAENSEEYKMQKSRFVGMRGNPQRPVVADVLSGAGRYLELYTSKARSIDYIRYIKRLSTAELGDNIMLPAALYKVVIYQVAGLTCITLNETERAQTLFGIAEGLLDSSKKEE